jgi:hypothetical protein
MRQLEGECLVGDTPILLNTDGTSLSIQNLFDENYTGPIVSWAPDRGSIMGRVVRVKRTSVGQNLVRVISHQRGYARDGSRLGAVTERVRYGHRSLVCTEGYPVWTERGWIPAIELEQGDVVKHETAAPKDRRYMSRYKHSVEGRLALSDKGDIRHIKNPYHPPTFVNRGGKRHGSIKARVTVAGTAR